MEALFAAGTGAGLSSIAGIRAYLPLALVGLFARLGLFTLPAPFDLLEDWLVIGALLVLALLESALDKIPALDPILDFVQTPIRAVAGAVLFSAALGAGLDVQAISELVVDGGIAGLVSVLKATLRPPARGAASVGVSAYFLSLFEDIVALLGGVVAVLVPLVPVVFVAFLLLFFFRVKRRRRRKYGGLRILGD